MILLLLFFVPIAASSPTHTIEFLEMRIEERSEEWEELDERQRELSREIASIREQKKRLKILNDAAREELRVLKDPLPLRGETPDAEIFQVSRYYTPEKSQSQYYHGSYAEDYRINCMNDCLVTASGMRLRREQAGKVAACPPDIPLWTILRVEGLGTVTCVDRGGAIKGRRLDVWMGIGQQALELIRATKGGERRVWKL